MLKETLKRNKGITLIALVVTIIVLLILAGISITMLTGQNGILNRAGEAKTTNGVAQGEELIKVSVMDALTRGTGELTDENLRKALSSNLGTEGEDYEIVGSEDCGWTVTIKENDKDYKISSTGKIGEIEKVEASSSEWRVEGNAVVEYLGSSNDIVVPNYVDGVKITEIGANIFQNSEKDGTLTISEGIKVIGEHTFESSKFVKNLVLPDTLEKIEDYAFAGCSGFTGNLVIPGGVETIGQYAFGQCVGFDGTLEIQNGVNDIGNYAFVACSNFKGDLSIPGTIQRIGEAAFIECKGFDGKLILNDGIKNIDKLAFCGCVGLNGNLIIPNTVENIGENGFYRCSGFTGDLIIPESVKQIGFVAFTGCTGFNGDLIISDNVELHDSFRGMPIEGTLYIGKNVTGMYLNGKVNAKRVIMKSIINDYATMQFLPNIESCWISSDIIKDIETIKMFTYEDTIKNKNMVIYTDATEDDENWPKDWNPNTLKVVYETSLDKYYELTD